MRGTRAVALTLAVAALAVGCTAESSSTSSTTTTTTPARLLREPRVAARAIADIVASIGAEVVQLRDVSFYAEYVIVEAQDPTNPEHIDRHEWRAGSVEPPEPVQLTGPQEDIEAELFPSTSVDWRTLPRRVREAEAAAEANTPLRIEEPQAQYLFVERSTSSDLDGRITLRIHINGPRRTGFVEMTASGEILQVNVS